MSDRLYAAAREIVKEFYNLDDRYSSMLQQRVQVILAREVAAAVQAELETIVRRAKGWDKAFDDLFSRKEKK